MQTLQGEATAHHDSSHKASHHDSAHKAFVLPASPSCEFFGNLLGEELAAHDMHHTKTGYDSACTRLLYLLPPYASVHTRLGEASLNRDMNRKTLLNDTGGNRVQRAKVYHAEA